jgi:hypothetical protein
MKALVAVLLLVAESVGGALLIQRTVLAHNAPARSSRRDPIPPTTTTTTAPTTTTSTIPPTTTTTVNTSLYAKITVRVANGAGINGLAERVTTFIGQEGFDVVAPVNATSSVTSTIVYYAPGFSVAAGAVAARLGLAPSAVRPDPASLPVNAPPEDINVIAGPDVSSLP